VRLRFTLGILGAVLVACGGSKFVVGSDADGGGSSVDQDSSTQADTGAGAACVSLPSNTGGEQQFCEDEQYIFTKCGNCEQCRKDDLQVCRTLGDTLSDAFKKAIHDCRDSNICGDYTTYANSACVRQKFSGSQPTSAQRDARDQYCQQCPQNPNECAHFFDLGGDAGVGSTSGIGAYVLVASDAIVNTMNDGCNGATNCPPLAYQLCTGQKLCAAAPADKCKTGFCFK